MTRTERATSPRAILKDRTESKSGHDKSLRKGGAGGHNWGSLKDELDHEREALEDIGDLEDADELVVDANVTPTIIDKTNDVMSEEDVHKAREFREEGLNGEGEVNLSNIARTSAGATSEHPAPPVEITRDAATSTIA